MIAMIFIHLILHPTVVIYDIHMYIISQPIVWIQLCLWDMREFRYLLRVKMYVSHKTRSLQTLTPVQTSQGVPQRVTLKKSGM